MDAAFCLCARVCIKLKHLAHGQGEKGGIRELLVDRRESKYMFVFVWVVVVGWWVGGCTRRFGCSTRHELNFGGAECFGSVTAADWREEDY